jgi:hypothetical protein
MLTTEISLWPSGPVVMLGSYFIAWKYLFSAIFLSWAVAFLRWPSRRWLLAGTLGLAILALVVLTLPLGRPYGLVEGGPALFEVANPMVAAARKTATDGWLVAGKNPFPLWSLALAAVSGFDPERLLAVYSWIPVLALTCFVFGLYSWARSVEGEEATSRFGAPLAVFFAVFLSTDRLAFLRDGATVWTATFWLRPRLVCAMALLFSFLSTLGRGKRLGGFVAAGTLLAAAAWTEPRVAFLGAVATVVAVVARRNLRPLVSLAVASSLFALSPVPWISRWPDASGTGSGGLEALYAMTIDRGLIFVLALFGSFRLFRSPRNLPSALFLGLLASTFALYVVGCGSEAAAQWFDRELSRSTTSVLLASAAGLGLAGLLADVAKTKRYRFRPLDVWGLVLFLAVSLSWCFPYWWHPVRMDETYRESIVPVSRQRIELASWIRGNTPSDAVFAAGPTYGPWISALSGRRLLWIEGADDGSRARRQAQSRILESGDTSAIREAVGRWGVTHAAWGRLDAGGPVEFPSDFVKESPLFSEVHTQKRWVVVYELRP